MELPLEAANDTFTRDEFPETKDIDIRRAAMNLLARREHSGKELHEKLSRRFPDAGNEQILIQVDRLTNEGLQSDERLAEAFTRARVRRGQGPVRIRMELKGKGIDRALIDSTLLSFTLNGESVDWSALAAEVAERKYPELHQASEDPRLRGKITRFLQQRGFTLEHFNHLF